MPPAASQLTPPKRRRWWWAAVLLPVVIVLLITVYAWALLLSINQDLETGLVSDQPVSLRPIPYPFRAALGLKLSPGPGLDLEGYVRALDYLSSTGQTELGPGLGLDVAGSITFYSPGPDIISYYGPGGDNPDQSRLIWQRLIRTGRVDVLDSYGRKDRFTRSNAEAVLSLLEGQGLPLTVWSDRYPGDDDLVLGDGRGAHPGRISYHLNLTIGHGVRFFGLNRTTPLAGQEIPIGWDMVHCPSTDVTGLASAWSWFRSLADYTGALLFGRSDDPVRDNRLVGPVTFKDGSQAYEYITYAPPGDPPGLGPINPDCLDRLLAEGGVMVLDYSLKPTADGRPWPETDQVKLELLSELNRQGQLMVTKTSHLVRLAWARRALKWHFELNGQSTVIHLDRVDDVITGPRPPRVEELAGLTFYVPRADRTKVYLGERLIPVRANLLDYTGRESVTIPWSD